MSKIITVEIEAKEFGYDDIKVGDFVVYKDEVYILTGFDYGTYPIAKRLSDGEIIELPSY